MKTFILAALFVVVVIGSAQAEETPTCIIALMSCTNYVNSTATPSLECCNNLKAELKSSLPCVCSIYGDSEFMKATSLNIKNAISLPMRCGIKVNLVTYCKAALAPASSPASSPNSDDASSPESDDDSESPNLAPGPSSSTTIVTTTPGPSSNTSSSIAMSGIVLLGSFLMWATLMFY